MKTPISTGRKLTWNEEFIFKPLVRFIGKTIALIMIFLFFFGLTYATIKLIKLLWFL
jgi:hypothetical protein